MEQQNTITAADMDAAAMALQGARYVRVNDRYYEYAYNPNTNSYCWIARDKKELKQDGVSVTSIKQYNGWTVRHNFTGNYEKVIHNYLNLSLPLQHHPKRGDWVTIEKLLRHIFGEQYEIGLDYYTLLIRNPEQMLPILTLVSQQRGTGKSTLLNFNNWLFGANSIIMTVGEYRQPFNSLFATKLLIQIDETAISESFVKEQLKKDSTAKTIQMRRMRCEHETLPFYGKFIMATNSETSFMNIESDEIRFWVRKVPVIADGYNPLFEGQLKKEIPAFLNYIQNEHTLTVNEAQSRMWFSPEQIHTDALDRVIENSISDLAKEINLMLLEMADERGLHNICMTATDVKNWLNSKYSRVDISTALDELKLERKTGRYTHAMASIEGVPKQCNGNYWCWNKG